MDKPVMTITVQDIAAILQRRTSRDTPLWGGGDSDGRKLRVLIERSASWGEADIATGDRVGRS